MDENALMEMIYSDMEDQEELARRKGIPIEMSKYTPEESEEQEDYDDYGDDYGEFEGQDFDNFGQNIHIPKEEKKARGLNNYEINRLVTDTYKRGETSTDPDCPICSKEKEEGDLVIRLPCLHTYHSECLVPWLQMKSVCPTCKYDLTKKWLPNLNDVIYILMQVLKKWLFKQEVDR